MNESTIYQKLYDFFEPDFLEVKNESYKHWGHSGSPNTGNSHFLIKIKSKKLSDLTRLDGERKIYSVLQKEMKNHIHALSIKIID
tara:strand:- start:2340 stop:2594 length:255 start_codon:yes stop_codon:yes gene_type:complete